MSDDLRDVEICRLQEEVRCVRAEVERLRTLALQFLNEQTDENAAALRAALEPKP